MGTWTKVFDDREVRLIREESELAFLEIRDTESGPRVELLKWEDASRSVRRVKVFRR